MPDPTHEVRSLITGCAVAGAVFALTGCGGGASPAPPLTRPTSAVPSPAASVAAAQPASLRIVSPKRGAYTATTLTVNVHLTGASPLGPRPLRYVLDGVLTRAGALHLTFHGLAPGRHHLEVMLNGDRKVRAGTVFAVRAPVVLKAAPVTPTEAPPASPPAVSTPESPPPAAGIPQGGGGDGDGDNSGGPSDGDGNV